MTNKRRNRKLDRGAQRGALNKARARMKLAANVTEEQDWYLDTPDVRLSRIFMVVLLLHVVAFGGVLAFKLIDKASATSGMTITRTRGPLEDAVQDSRQVAASVAKSPAVVGVGEATATAEAPAQQAPPLPLRADNTRADQYKVQPGETLAEIADTLGLEADALRQANAIRSDNELYPGRWLTLPKGSSPLANGSVDKAAAVAPSVPSAPSPLVATERMSTYTVKAGDTAWGIAKQVGVPFGELMKANGITRPESLQIGQTLRLP
jgi:LysM repeat protein